MTVTGFFQVCHSWLDQESKNCKSIVTMKYKEDTKESTLMIEDWETGQLYLRYLKIHKKNEALACAEVKKQYFDNFAKTKDLYFFMGTTREHHLISKNPFIIIGVFYPPLPNHSPQPEQLKLF